VRERERACMCLCLKSFVFYNSLVLLNLINYIISFSIQKKIKITINFKNILLFYFKDEKCQLLNLF
jgi:hypothetical protein